jgi:hypothetical protein
VDLGRKFQTTRCSEDGAHFSKPAHLRLREKLSAIRRSASYDEYAHLLLKAFVAAEVDKKDVECFQ